MLARVDVRGRDGDLRAVLARPAASTTDLRDSVGAILARVQAEGDEALYDLTEQFDHCALAALAVPGAECRAALARLEPLPPDQQMLRRILQVPLRILMRG